MEVLSYRNNKMYLYGEVDEQGDIVNQYQYINMTVEALQENCEGRITCLTEQIKPPKKVKPISNKNILLRHGGVNLATRGKTIEGDDIAFKKSKSALSLYSVLNTGKEVLPRRQSQGVKVAASKATTNEIGMNIEFTKRKGKF